MKYSKFWVFGIVLLISKFGFSYIYVCGNHTNSATGYTSKQCHVFTGKCDDEKNLSALENGFPGGWTCINFGLAISEKSDAHLINMKDGSAYLVINGERTPVGSDAFLAFLMRVQRETENMRVNSQVIQDKFDKFLDSDNGYVSNSRLNELSMELGVPIEHEGSSNPENQPRIGRGTSTAPSNVTSLETNAAKNTGSADSDSRRPDECSLPDCSCRVVNASGVSLCEGGTEEETGAGIHYCKCGKFGPSTIQSGGPDGKFTLGNSSAIGQHDRETGGMKPGAKPTTPKPTRTSSVGHTHLQAQRQYASTPTPPAEQEPFAVNSRPAPRQELAGVPGEEYSPSSATLRNLQRKGVFLDHLLGRMILNPANTRQMTSLSITPMNRDLTENDIVYFVEPLSYAILNTENFNPWGISYFWEVVSTDQGILLAIPVPNIASYSRAPVACPCDSEHEGTCSSTGFCFYSLPVDKCVLKPIVVEDPELCISLSRTAQGGPADVNFIDIFSARLGRQNVSIVVRGNIGIEPFERKIWASFYAPGVGCFLEGNVDTTMENKQVSAAKIRNTLSANGLTGRYEVGIAKETTKTGNEDQGNR